MPGSIVCNVCGGKDFYNEAGFYFCNECQTQTQEIREQVFDQQDNTAHLRITKTTVRKERSFSNVKLTSWEVFNHILYGLVEELNVLGVNKDFKEVCFHLWIYYLTKLEIMSKVPDGLPKLNACFRRRDAEIIYNRSFTRKRKPRSASASVISSVNSSTNDLDMKMMRKERAKRRRKLVRAEYDEFSNTNPSSETSLHNRTLSSLGSDDESVSSSGSQLVFSKAAKQALLKIMTSEHLNLHMKDTENEMKCHRFSRKLLKSSYNDANVLTRNKLYSIIYIALLLTEDKFQLSDILRFCREGHLSYMEYKHFFPDIITENCIDENVYLKGARNLIASDSMRKQTWDIYKVLQLNDCEISPDLIELCKRYCTELNLPDEVFNMAADFINKTKPKFPLNLKTTIFPNYEGRVMGFIMFVLKVLFSFDGSTEYEFSKFAKLINKKEKLKMFVFDEWFNYIQYRKLVLKNTHFPTKFLFEPNCRDSVDLYFKFIQQRKIIYDQDEPATLSMKIAKKYLTDLEVYQDSSTDYIEFKPSVTPFRTYIDFLKNIENFTINNVPINQEILIDRSKDSVDHIIHHSSFLKSIKSSKCERKLSGKNTNHVFRKIRNNNWDILNIHERKWHKSFEKGKMELIHFDKLLVKILDKQIKNVENNIFVNNVNPKIVENNVKPIEEPLSQSLPIIKYVDKTQIAVKNNVGRNNKGRFCKKNSTENIGIDNFHPKHSKWHVSSWSENPSLTNLQYNPSLAYQVVNDCEKKMKKHFNGNIINDDEIQNNITLNGKKCVYPMHYFPWLEHWINIQEVNSRTSMENWKEFHETLPKNFQWLLGECATTIEQSPMDLFAEFVNVELYMCYVHIDNTPILNKYCDNYKSITKLINKIKNIW